MNGSQRKPSKAARNERRKALATTFNALSVAVFVAALVQPLLTGHLVLWLAATAIALFLVLQTALHYVLTRLED